MSLAVYVGVAVVCFGGGWLCGYLHREAQYWGEVADKYRAMRNGISKV